MTRTVAESPAPHRRVMASGALDPAYSEVPRKVLQSRTLAREVQAQEAPAAMPSAEPSRSAEAIKRALPALVKIDRYEQRARAARDRAVRQLGIVEGTWISTESSIRAEQSRLLASFQRFKEWRPRIRLC